MRLEAKDLYYKYNKKMDWVIENQSFSIESGEKVGVFAPSGYGKSTLALLLSGYLKPSSGEILLDNQPLPTEGVCPVQLIYQHPEKAINPRWRLKSVLEESGVLREDVLSSFGIEEEWLNRFPRELSGGELQRFCVARALLSGCKFLICDEISTMLDVITQAQIWNKVMEEVEKKEIGLMVITHNLALAKKLCTKIYDIEKNLVIDC